MSQCVTVGGQCCCMKIKVKWCEYCQMFICRVEYNGHLHMTPAERQLSNARKGLISWLDYRAYLLREGIIYAK